MNYFKLQIQKNILIANFYDPLSKNAFGLDAAREFAKIQKVVLDKKYDGLILTSHNDIFCSGGNLQDYARQKKRAQGIRVNNEITKILNSFSQLALPTVAIVNGDCWGGGLEWLSAFDQVYTLPHIYFGMWQRRIGLTWGWGGGKRLCKRLSAHSLLTLLLNGASFDAYTALHIGLVDAICPQDIALENAINWIGTQSALPKTPIKKIKNELLNNERKIFHSLWMNPEHRAILKKYTR